MELVVVGGDVTDPYELFLREETTATDEEENQEPVAKKQKASKPSTPEEWKKQTEVSGKEWDKHPLGLCVKKNPRFVRTVENLCKWIMRCKLDETLSAVWAYIRLEVCHQQMEDTNEELDTIVVEDNRKAKIPQAND